MNGCVSEKCKLELTKLQNNQRDPNYQGQLNYEWLHCDTNDCHTFVHANNFECCEDCDVVLCENHIKYVKDTVYCDHCYLLVKKRKKISICNFLTQ